MTHLSVIELAISPVNSRPYLQQAEAPWVS